MAVTCLGALEHLKLWAKSIGEDLIAILQASAYENLTPHIACSSSQCWQDQEK